MTGETEHWTWRIAPSGIASFDAPSSAPAIVDPAGGGNPHNAILAPPKGATVQLKRMHGYILSSEGITDTSRAMKVVLAIIASAQTPALGVIDLRTVWACGLFHTVAGTPANAALAPATVPIEVEFDPEHRHSHIHNGGARQGSEEFGFAFVHTATADYNYFMDLMLDYDVVWDEPSGISKLKEEEWEDYDIEEGEA